MSNKNRYLFDHIPKTGGQALYSVFKKMLGDSNVSPLIIDKFSTAVLDSSYFKLIQGHFIFFPKDRESLKKFFSIILLRDPIHRVLSNYSYFKNDIAPATGSQFEAIRLAKSLDLLDFLNHKNPLIVEMVNNYQTNHLLQLQWDGSTDLSENEKLNLAKKALHYYDLVGVYHQFTDFVDLLCYQCGWPPILEIPQVNVTTKRAKPSEIDHKIIQRLKELNQVDLALYEYATQLFNENKRKVMHECIARKHQEITKTSVYPSLVTKAAQATPIIASSQNSDSQTEEAISTPANFGNRQLEILGINVKGTISPLNTLFSDELTTIRITFRANVSVNDLTVGIHIHDLAGHLVFGTNSECLGHRLEVRAGSVYFIDYTFRNDLGQGQYTIGAALHRGGSHLSGCYHWRDEVTRFQVIGNVGYHFEGQVKLHPLIRGGVLNGDPAGFRAHFTGFDWPRLQQIAVHTPKLSEFAAQIRLLQPLERLHPNEVIAVEAEITNTSSQIWGASGQSPVRISYRWLSIGGDPIESNGERTPLPRDIVPGETFRAWITIKAPPQPANAQLRLTLVQENVAWFDKRGCPSLEIRVSIER